MVSGLLELLQRPVVSGSIFQVLDLHSHHGTRERPGVTFFLWLGRQKLRGEWGVQRVRQKNKLELDLQRKRESSIVFEERGKKNAENFNI